MKFQMTSCDWWWPLNSRLPTWLLVGALAGSVLGACADFERGPLSPDSGTPGGGGGDGGSSGGGGVSFASAVHPLLVSGCQSCHQGGGAAGNTAFVMTGDATADFTEASSLIDTSTPSLSRLTRKAAGLGHGGGAIYAEGTPEHQTLLNWVSGGANP